MTPALPPLSVGTASARIRLAHNLDELVHAPFAEGVNAWCWPRSLNGDFAEIEQALPPVDGITPLEEADLNGLRLRPAGALARQILIDDLRQLTGLGLQPSLDLVPAGNPETYPGVIRTDVQDFHVDSATVAADTFLCSYNVAATEGLRNEDAIRRVDEPVTRAALLTDYGGRDDAGFRAYLHRSFYDLHYAARPGAQPFSFGLGHLWRIAIAHPGCPVPPCIHRAPTPSAGQPRRLLLIS